MEGYSESSMVETIYKLYLPPLDEEIKIQENIEA